MKNTICKIFTCLLLVSLPAYSSIYYVSNSGNDGNPGTQSQPWASLQFAANNVQPGDSVRVENGIYGGFSIATKGTVNMPIVFEAMGSDVVLNTSETRDIIEIENAHYVVIDGFRIANAERAGISVVGYHNDECLGVHIKNCRIYNNGRWGIFTGYAKDIRIEHNETSYSGSEHGVYVSNSSDNPVIANNIAHHNNGSGIQINADPVLAGDGIISNALVENNICYENGVGGGAALNFASIRNSIIKNNILYENHAGGLAFWDDGFGNQMGCKNNKIYNNTVVMPSDGRWAINMINNSTGNEVINNILLHKGSRGSLEIDASSMDGLLSDYNIMAKISYNENWISLSDWQNQSGQDQNSFSASASDLFADVGSYHLKENSAALDKGKNLPEVLYDIDGDSRPAGAATDIGADELAVTAIKYNKSNRPAGALDLLGNYPNPFNASTTIQYYLSQPATIKLKVYDLTGKNIANLQKETEASGFREIIFDASALASGIYIYRLFTNHDISKTGMMSLVK